MGDKTVCLLSKASELKLFLICIWITIFALIQL